MIKSPCPECDQDVLLDTVPNMGEHVVCSGCRTTLVVIWLSPVRLDWAFIDPIDRSTSNPENKLAEI